MTNDDDRYTVKAEGGIDFAYSLDGGYIGSPKEAQFLCGERGIAPQKAAPDDTVCSIGFCEKEQKWYGWSHRAMYGFGVGSTVKKGDCGYVAPTPEGLIEDHAAFYADISKESAERHRAECQILPDRSGIRILHAPLLLPVVSLDDLDSALDGEPVVAEQTDISPGYTEVKCGRGEWTAETLSDAREMAMDFAKSVS